MRNIRLKLVLFFLVSALGVGIYIWVNNFKQIDILRTKNDSISNALIHKIKNSTDIEFIRENAINKIKWNKENRHQKSNVAVSQSKLILLQLILIFLSLILGIIQFIKQKNAAQQRV